MIYGYAEDERPTKKNYQDGEVDCGRLGCDRTARHEWALPCAVNTRIAGSGQLWIPLCDVCDVAMNRALLEVLGYHSDILDVILADYSMIQGDIAFDKPEVSSNGNAPPELH